MKVAMFSAQSYDESYFEGQNQDASLQFAYFETALNPKTAVLAKGYKAVCVFVNDILDQSTIQRLSEFGIEIIALRCAGYNNVDLDAAKAHNIKVVRVPAYSPQAVAEHTLALILTLNRKVHKAYSRVREANFSLEKLEGFNLYQKTIGVIGTGKIGTAFCEILQGFGVRILASDPVKSDFLKGLGVIYTDLDHLLKESDIISLHCPLLPQTHHIINAEAVAKMKKGVMLINTSRGGLIHTKAVINALKKQHIGYLGIDVYEQEKDLFFRDLSESIIQDEVFLRLLTFPNVIITAHQAFFTKEALSEIAETSIENLLAFKNGEKLVNELV